MGSRVRHVGSGSSGVDYRDWNDDSKSLGSLTLGINHGVAQEELDNGSWFLGRAVPVHLATVRGFSQRWEDDNDEPGVEARARLVSLRGSRALWSSRLCL